MNSRVWLVWLFVTATIVSLVRHPLYSILLILIVLLARALAATQTQLIEFSLWRLGFFILFFSGLINGLSAHIGRTILFTLPDSIPIIGGNITLEAIVFGIGNGLLLLALLVTFVAFNQIVSVTHLVRLMPAGLRDVGIVVSIALTYVPQTVSQLNSIRDAQALRGHQVKGLRDWVPLVIPLLVGGLERALNLAEAMVARGYGQTVSQAQSLWGRLIIFSGLVIALAGWVFAIAGRSWGWLVMLIGLLLILGRLWWQGRQVKRTVYRPNPFTLRDLLATICLLIPLVVIWLLRNRLVYSPYPELTLPPFNPLIGVCLMLLLVPAILQRQAEAME